MSKNEARDFLINLFPEFSEIWNSESNYQKNGDNYTYHGLFMEFSPFFINKIDSFSDEQLRKLFSTVEDWELKGISSQDNGDNKASEAQQLANAAFTCFLENISREGLSQRIKPFMGEKSLEYYSHYDN